MTGPIPSSSWDYRFNSMLSSNSLIRHRGLQTHTAILLLVKHIDLLDKFDYVCTLLIPMPRDMAVCMCRIKIELSLKPINFCLRHFPEDFSLVISTNSAAGLYFFTQIYAHLSNTIHLYISIIRYVII